MEASYDVDGLGRVVKVKILTGLGHACDQEVIRLVKLLKFERVFNKGKNVTEHKKLKVDFKLPKAKPKTQQLNYQLAAKTTQQAPPEKSKAKSYSYTINLKN